MSNNIHKNIIYELKNLKEQLKQIQKKETETMRDNTDYVFKTSFSKKEEKSMTVKSR